MTGNVCRVCSGRLWVVRVGDVQKKTNMTIPFALRYMPIGDKRKDASLWRTRINSCGGSNVVQWGRKGERQCLRDKTAGGSLSLTGMSIQPTCVQWHGLTAVYMARGRDSVRILMSERTCRGFHYVTDSAPNGGGDILQILKKQRNGSVLVQEKHKLRRRAKVIREGGVRETEIGRKREIERMEWINTIFPQSLYFTFSAGRFLALHGFDPAVWRTAPRWRGPAAAQADNDNSYDDNSNNQLPMSLSSCQLLTC